MSCNTCIKLNPIPGCIDSEEFLLTGLTFPDYESTTITGMFIDVSTGRSVEFEIVVDSEGDPVMDVADFFPLDTHVYKIKFIAPDGTPANFLLTNPDSTTEEGCCIEFEPFKGLTASGEWTLSSQSCAVV